MPYKSKAQAAYFNIHRAELEKQGVDVDEWNAASKGKSLPKHAETKAKGRDMVKRGRMTPSAYNRMVKKMES
jgi:hypothetical protein